MLALQSCPLLMAVAMTICPSVVVLGAEVNSAHNRLGMNLSGIVDWNTEHPFADVFRLSRQWISQKTGQPWGKGPELDLDEHGWVKRLAPNCLAETPILTGGHAPAGKCVCLYDGEGEVDFGANSKVVSRANGRIVVNIDGHQEGTFLAIAPYISFMPSPDSKSLKAEEVAKWSLDQLLDRVETNALPECIGWMKTQKAVADKYGLKLVCYEAGQHLVGVGGGENNEALTKLLISANHHPRMGAIYEKYLEAWCGLGGDLMCMFSSVAASSKWGSWGLLEGADETSSPKFDAVIKWNQRNSR